MRRAAPHSPPWGTHSGADNGGVAGIPLPGRYSLGSAPPLLPPQHPQPSGGRAGSVLHYNKNRTAEITRSNGRLKAQEREQQSEARMDHQQPSQPLPQHPRVPPHQYTKAGLHPTGLTAAQGTNQSQVSNHQQLVLSLQPQSPEAQRDQRPNPYQGAPGTPAKMEERGYSR